MTFVRGSADGIRLAIDFRIVKIQRNVLLQIRQNMDPGRFCLVLTTISLATYSAVLLFKWERLGTGRGEQNVLATKGCIKRENGASF